MPVIYTTDLRNARLQQVIDFIDGGAGAGTLEIGTAGMATVLSSIVLALPSFSAPVAGQINLAGVPRSDASADASGLAAEARIKDGDGDVIIAGLTVGEDSSFDIQIVDADVQVNQEVRVIGGSIVHG